MRHAGIDSSAAIGFGKVHALGLCVSSSQTTSQQSSGLALTEAEGLAVLLQHHRFNHQYST